MFDRFTERARKVMTLSRQEAQKLRNDYIGTEHILLGLVQEGSGVAAQVLTNLGMDLRKVRAEVERLVEQGDSPVTGAQLPFTPRAKRVLELALDESQGLGHNYIGTEHLLLGLIREKDGPAAHVFQNLDVKAKDVRDGIVDLLGVDLPTGPGEERPGWFRRMLGTPSSSAESSSPAETENTARTGWESVDAPSAVDWLLVARMRVQSDATIRRRIPWAGTRFHLELLPRRGEWRYRFTVAVFPRGKREDALFITVPGGRLKDIEEELPGKIESTMLSIEGKAKGESAGG